MFSNLSTIDVGLYSAPSDSVGLLLVSLCSGIGQQCLAASVMVLLFGRLFSDLR